MLRRMLNLFVSCGTAVLMSGIGYNFKTWQWWVVVLIVNAICVLCREGNK